MDLQLAKSTSLARATVSVPVAGRTAPSHV
jgi:hypothetical protein